MYHVPNGLITGLRCFFTKLYDKTTRCYDVTFWRETQSCFVVWLLFQLQDPSYVGIENVIFNLKKIPKHKSKRYSGKNPFLVSNNKSVFSWTAFHIATSWSSNFCWPVYFHLQCAVHWSNHQNYY